LGTCGVLFFCGLLVQSCSNDDARATTTATSQLTVGFPGANLAGTDLGVGQFARLLTIEGLTQVSEDGRVLPRLAQRWTWEDEGRRLRLHLRPNVTFHDGTPLTSGLAADALKKAFARPSNLALYPSLSDVTAVEAQDNLQVLLTLSRPSAFLPEDLDVPISVGDGSVGTGAYRVVNRDQQELVLEGFDSYYLGSPAIRRIVVRPFDTLRTAWTSLLRGDVDMVSDVSPEAVEFIRNDDVQVISFARRYQFVIAFNSQNRPFVSPDVRRALNVAVDRERLIDRVLQGLGTPATSPLWPKHWAYDHSVPEHGFDPRLAASILDKESLPIKPPVDPTKLPPARFRFTCLIPSGFTLLERVALEIQKQLFDIAVDMQLELVSAADYDSRIRNGNFDAVLLDLISGPNLARPYIFWRSGKTSKGLNVFGYENAEAEELFQVLRSSTSEAAIRSASRRLQRVLQDDPPGLFLAWSQRTRAVRRGFTVVQDAERDPLFTLWRWTADNTSSGTRPTLTQ
jgi:peptide/nickel transport system substrate-binding protein